MQKCAQMHKAEDIFITFSTFTVAASSTLTANARHSREMNSKRWTINIYVYRTKTFLKTSLEHPQNLWNCLSYARDYTIPKYVIDLVTRSTLSDKTLQWLLIGVDDTFSQRKEDIVQTLTETACCNVCCNKDWRLAVAELPQDVVALLLALVAVHAHSRPAKAADVACDCFYLLFCFDKDNGFCAWFTIVAYFLQKII